MVIFILVCELSNPPLLVAEIPAAAVAYILRWGHTRASDICVYIHMRSKMEERYTRSVAVTAIAFSRSAAVAVAE